MTLYNTYTLESKAEDDIDPQKVSTYDKVNKMKRAMKCHAPLIPQYMESKNYKGKGLRKNEQGIEELPRNMIKSNEGKSGLG